jgi:hypothetical protein
VDLAAAISTAISTFAASAVAVLAAIVYSD